MHFKILRKSKTLRAVEHCEKCLRQILLRHDKSRPAISDRRHPDLADICDRCYYKSSSYKNPGNQNCSIYKTAAPVDYKYHRQDCRRFESFDQCRISIPLLSLVSCNKYMSVYLLSLETSPEKYKLEAQVKHIVSSYL